jgi:hypothetical protein
MEGGVAIILLLMLVAGTTVSVFGFSALGGMLSLSRRADSKRETGRTAPSRRQPSFSFAAPWSSCSASAPACIANIAATTRVPRGATPKPAVKAPATH